MSTGLPSASKTRLLAIAPTSQPSASAASAAVCTESGRTTTSTGAAPAGVLVSKSGDRGCSLDIMRDPSHAGGG